MTAAVAAATSDADIDIVRGLFGEYWRAFGFSPDFQGFDAEVAGLPGRYAPPEGRLGLALVGGAAAGCVALRRLTPERCEAKRLYVRPAVRGAGAGRALLDWLLAEARAAGYREIVADTMPVMERALALYETYGFERVPPYGEDPTPGAVYLRRSLT